MTTISHFDDMMLDIETLALSNTQSVILSIGMVSFDPSPVAKPEFGPCHMLVPQILPQIMKGRIVQPGTVKFWQDQSPEARAHFEQAPGYLDPQEVCERLQRILQPVKRLWANGILFDLGNVGTFYEQFTGKQAPWHYRAPTDMRTFCRNTPERRISSKSRPPLVDHNPIDDCVNQIWHVWEHYDGADNRATT